MREGKIILCNNIRLNKYYTNVLNYTTEEMLTLCNSNALYTKNNYSFIRKDNTIRVECSYDTCLKCNYMAFQNPDYSNKWFFAFIDNIEYVSNNATAIKYTIDVFQTFWTDLTIAKTFVVREHVNNDNIGANLYEEGLTYGEYTCNGSEYFGFSDRTNCYPVIAVTEKVIESETNLAGNIMGGVPQGLIFYVGDIHGAPFIRYVTSYASEKKKPEMIEAIFMVPKELLINLGNANYFSEVTKDGIVYKYHRIAESDYIYNSITLSTKNISKPYGNVNGYVPKNKKLFVYPYNYLMVDNNAGSSFKYRYEDFSGNTASFKTEGVISIGSSIRTVPLNYKNVAINNSEGINAGKLPIGSYVTDPFINWLTQNGVNIAASIFSTGISSAGTILMATSPVVAGVTLATGAISMGATMGNLYVNEQKIPDQVSGNTNSGDVTFASGRLRFCYYKMSIKYEYAQKLDNYFTRYGYKVCMIKTPNITGRRTFNYVEIGDGESIGYGNIPNKYMEDLNNIFRAGVTIWHHHNEIGNFNLDNSII